MWEDDIAKAIPILFAEAHRMHKLVPSIDEEEFSQEGFVALLECARKYDPSRVTKLSSFAYPAIREAMLALIRNNTPATTTRHGYKTGHRGYAVPLEDDSGEEYLEGDVSRLHRTETMEIMESAMSALSENDVALIDSIFFEDMSLGEAGEMLGYSKSTAHRRMLDALGKVRNQLVLA